VKKYPDDLPPDAEKVFLDIGRKLFDEYKDFPEVQAFWWPRFESMAAWFVENEYERRKNNIKLLKAEAQGSINLNGFTLKGRADRIDRLPEGTLAISDYKTGYVPSQKEVAAGYEPQLPLLALIAAEGGFTGILPASAPKLEYWKLGNAPYITMLKDAGALREKARVGLQQLIVGFANPAMPYLAVPRLAMMPRYDDYAHLARLKEWGRTEEDA